VEARTPRVRGRSWAGTLPGPLGPLAAIPAGLVIGALCAFSSAQKPIVLFLFLGALLVLLPTFFSPDVRLYWLSVYLFALQFDVKKTLLDGLAVIEALKLDAWPWVFVPEIMVSDLPLLVLLGLWLYDLKSQGKPLWIPRISGFALAFLGWAALSLLAAPSRYLGVIELVRQSKFVLVYLYAANNLDSDRKLRRMWLMLSLMILLQGATTTYRFAFQFYEPFFGDLFGRSSPLDMRHFILDPTGTTWLRGLHNSFGTTMSGAVTAQNLLLALPLAFLGFTRNPLINRRLACFLVFLVGMAGLLLTASRASAVGGFVALFFCYWVGIRRGYISPRPALLLGAASVLVFAVVGPLGYEYFSRKTGNVEIRLEQYATAWAMFEAHPLVGVGLNNSVVDARRYGRYSFSLNDVRNRTYETPIHSFPLVLLTEVGSVGFLLYFGMLVGVGWKAWRLSRSSVRPELAFTATALLVALIGLEVALLPNPLFDDGVQSLTWFYLGVIMALERRASDSLPITGGTAVTPPRHPGAARAV